MSRNKDNSGLNKIVADYSPRLRNYIRRRVDNAEDAEDILQEVFYQLVRSTHKEETEIEKLSAWLFTVARNAILNLWRKRGDTIDISEDNALEQLGDAVFSPQRDNPETELLRKLVWQELDYALAEMPEAQREVFCLTVFDGKPMKEISEQTGVSVPTLLSRKHYAVKFLRIRLRGLYEDILSSF